MRTMVGLVLIGLVGAPAGGGDVPGTAGAIDAAPGAEIFLATQAERVRELSFLSPVPVRHLSDAEYRAELEAGFADITDDSLREYAETYGRLGFFDIDLDLRPIFVSSRFDTSVAFYSPTDKRVTLVGEAPEDRTLVHEYVHALQDQHFDLATSGSGRTSDAFLARRALTEGDATMAE